MKSKIISFSMVTDAWRKQLWVFAISCVAFFLVYPMVGMMELENWIEYSMTEPRLTTEVMQRIFGVLYLGKEGVSSPSLEMVLLVSAGLGILTAANGFSYLHSRTKVDFYHSLPLRRETLFLQQGLVGAINYLIPAFFGVVLLMGVGAFRNVFTLQAFGTGLISLLIGFLFYFLSFALASLAMLLTGKILVGCLGIGVLFGYGPMIWLMLQWHCGHFFYTFTENPLDQMQWWMYLSPVTWAVLTGEEIGNGKIGSVMGALLVGVILMALCVWVYRKRRSEAAGQAMAFSKVGMVVQILLTATGALAAAMFFQSTVGRRSDLWLGFGLLFGLLLTYSVIQMILETNIRRILAGKWRLLAGGLAALAIASVFRFDLTGFDRYIPGQDEIANVGIYTNNFLPELGTSIMDGTRASKMKLACTDQIYQLLQDAQAGAEHYNEATDNRSIYQEPDDPVTSISVKYELKDGSVKYRNYICYFDEVREGLSQLYDNPEFLKYCNIVGYVEPEKVHEISIYKRNENTQIFRADDKARLQLVDALQKDIQELDSRAATQERPVYTLECVVDLADMGFEYRYGRGMLEYAISPEKPQEALFTEPVYIYPSYERTIAVLEELGYQESNSLEAETIEKITHTSYDQYGEETVQVYTKKKDIEKILPHLVKNYLTTIWMDLEVQQVVTVEFKGDRGIQDYRILKEKK